MDPTPLIILSATKTFVGPTCVQDHRHHHRISSQIRQGPERRGQWRMAHLLACLLRGSLPPPPSASCASDQAPSHRRSGLISSRGRHHSAAATDTVRGDSRTTTTTITTAAADDDYDVPGLFLVNGKRWQHLEDDRPLAAVRLLLRQAAAQDCAETFAIEFYHPG